MKKIREIILSYVVKNERFSVWYDQKVRGIFIYLKKFIFFLFFQIYVIYLF